MSLQETQETPPRLTTFVGREAELAEITRLLADPACRLLTLVGQGGVGKTRLAWEVMGLAADEFTHGSTFIALQALSAPDLLVPTMADGLGLQLAGEPLAQLCHYVQDKEMLLVLDNFEHLLAGAPLLTSLLQAAPGLKLLLTSREALSLQEEWIYSLHGLPFPAEAGESWDAYGAVQLFVERARRVRPSFVPDSEAEGILQICQLVEGIPLALELAATWTKTLSCKGIAQEIHKNIAFLSTKLRNIPERHRSMQAVFAQSWQQLTAEEQAVFPRLSVFSGGFLPEAAKIVAGASLPVLSILVDKSLLRWDENGRYHMHELLRQYAADHLNANPDIAQKTRSLHGYYYSAFMAQRTLPILGHRQVEIVQEVSADIENIRAAWRWAMTEGQSTALAMMAETFYYFGDFQGHFRENTNAFEQAITYLRLNPNQQGVPLTIAILQALLGWNYIRLGQFDKSRAAFTAAQTIYAETNEIPPPGFGTSPEAGMALLEQVIGNYGAALDWCQRSLAPYQARDDKFNVQIILYVLANIHFALGDYESAWERGQSAYALTLEMGNGWMMAYIHIVLGDIARAQNEYETARQHYQASYDLKQTLNDPEGMATALTHLAKLAWLQKDYAQAAQLYEQSLAIYRQIFDQGGLVRTLKGMGETAQALGEWESAVAHYRQALHIAHQMSWEPLILAICTSVASYYQQSGHSQRAIELASLVYHHPATEQETRDQIQKLFSNNLTSSSQLDLAPTVTNLLTDLTAPLLPQSSAPPPASASPLLDPLTPRELEVLLLIADGLTNRAIAEQLVITVGTVKSYTSQIYSKLGVSSRTQAVAQAREIGLLSSQ